jgi:hypothetical protein
MIRLPKFLLPVGVILVLGAFILTAPRTVHAVAAALVEVTNTSSNPVVTQTTGAQATNMVHLHCTFNMYLQSSPCFQVSTNGGLIIQGPGNPYTVPNANYLVITAADVTPQAGGTASCPGFFDAVIGTFNFTGILNLVTSNSPITTHFTYPPPSGIVIAPGTGVTAVGAIFNPTTGQFAGSCSESANDVVNLYGYLTTN